MSLRHNFEAGQTAILLAGAVTVLILGAMGVIPSASAYAIAFLMAVLSLISAKQAWERLNLALRLLALPQAWITHSDFCKKVLGNRGKVWIGKGFPWGKQQLERIYDLTQRQDKEVLLASVKKHFAWLVFFAKHPADCLCHPLRSVQQYKAFKQKLGARKGDPTMHAIGKEGDIWLDRSNISQNVLIVGATGSGKTRIFDTLIDQAIMADDCTAIFDPKGDPGLRSNVMLSAKAAGRESQVIVIDLANPEHSLGFNPLADITPPSRAGALIGQGIPGSGNNRAFRDFGIQVMSSAAEGIALMGKALTLRRIRMALEDRQRFAVDVLKIYLTETCGASAVSAVLPESTSVERQLSLLVDLYRSKGTYKSEVDAVIELGQHNAEHFSKMITTTLLHLQRLTNGVIGDLLSPEENTNRMFLDARKVREKNLIVCFELGALLDKTTCSAVGSLILTSLISLAGDIYSYAPKKGIPITLVVDEASEMMSEPFLQLLAEGRAAGYNTILATQTVADFVAKGSSPADDQRVLANVNNIIALRCNDPDTQKLLSEKFGKTTIRVVTQSHGVSRETGDLLAQGGNVSEHEAEKDLCLVSPACLGSLPDCEFFAMVQGGKLFKCRIAIILEKATDYRGL